MLRSTVSLVLLALLLYRLVRMLSLSGVFKANIYHHFPGDCRYPPGYDPEKGSEDLTILPEGFAVVSTGVLTGHGTILLVDLNQKEEKAEPFKIEGDWDLTEEQQHFHGISAWVNPKTGDVTLAVIDHPTSGDRIEIFRVDVKKRQLTLIEIIPYTYSGVPNDLVLVDDKRFYVTEFLRTHHAQSLEMFLSVPINRIFFYDGSQFHLAASGLVMPNGIGFSPDRKYLYVVECMANRLVTFRTQADGLLEKVIDHDIATAGDNLEVDPLTGDIWIGAHPNPWRFLAIKITFPSQVLRLKMKDGNVTDITEVLYDTGSRVQGSSVASIYKNKIIIGTIQKQLLVCDVKYLD